MEVGRRLSLSLLSLFLFVFPLLFTSKARHLPGSWTLNYVFNYIVNSWWFFKQVYLHIPAFPHCHAFISSGNVGCSFGIGACHWRVWFQASSSKKRTEFKQSSNKSFLLWKITESEGKMFAAGSHQYLRRHTDSWPVKIHSMPSSQDILWNCNVINRGQIFWSCCGEE